MPSAAAEPAAGTAVGTVYMPATMKDYYEGAIVGAISGRVTVKGKSVQAIPLDLRRYDGSKETIIASTQTSTNGYYQFENIASLDPGEELYVTYGSNKSNSSHVYFWYGPIIDEYRQGDSTSGGSFDIADVPLLSPASGAKLNLPITFSWQKRGIPGDTYRLIILDLEEDIFWRSFDLGDVDSYTLNAPAPDMNYNKQYAWYVEVYSEPDSFGESFQVNDIILLPALAQQGVVAPENSAFMSGTGRGGR
jgi:hypothetical protein